MERKLLTVQMQGVSPMLWALVDPHSTQTETTILTRGTGHPIDNGVSLNYIGTYQIEPLVFHVFSK